MHNYKYILLIFIIFVHGNRQCLTEINLIKLISNLNGHFNAEWNLIIGPTSAYNKEINYFVQNMRNSVVLKTLQKNDENEKDIFEIFSHNVLTIVCYNQLEQLNRNAFNTTQSMHRSAKSLSSASGVQSESFGNGEELLPAANFAPQQYYKNKKQLQSLDLHLTSLVRSLFMLHHTPIIWIFPPYSDDIVFLQQLSEQCWRKGLTSVLFLVNKEIYTYRPLPFVKVLHLRSWKQFGRHNNVANFYGHPFRFPITPSAPRCYRYIGRQGDVVTTGYFYDLLMTFIQQYNFSFTEYPNDYSIDNKQVLFQNLMANKFDVVPFLAYRNRRFWASDVLWNVNAVLLVPKARPMSKFNYFTLPFKGVTWSLHLISILLSSTVVCFSVYLKASKLDFSQALLYAVSLAIYQNHFLLFRNRYHVNSMVYMIVFLYGFIMVQMYLCKLSSLLVLTIYEPQMRSLSDINSTDLKLFIAEEDILHFLSSSILPDTLLERMIITDGIGIDKIRRSLNNSLLHMGFEDKIQFFLLQQKFLQVPLVQLIDPVILTEPIFFTMRHNLPFTQLFNRYLKYVAESGLLQKILNDIERHGILSGEIRYMKNPVTESEQFLTLEYFYAPLILYVGGMAASILVFLVELLLHLKQRSK